MCSAEPTVSPAGTLMISALQWEVGERLRVSRELVGRRRPGRGHLGVPLGRRALRHAQATAGRPPPSRMPAQRRPRGVALGAPRAGDLRSTGNTLPEWGLWPCAPASGPRKEVLTFVTLRSLEAGRGGPRSCATCLCRPYTWRGSSGKLRTLRDSGRGGAGCEPAGGGSPRAHLTETASWHPLPGEGRSQEAPGTEPGGEGTVGDPCWGIGEPSAQTEAAFTWKPPALSLASPNCEGGRGTVGGPGAMAGGQVWDPPHRYLPSAQDCPGPRMQPWAGLLMQRSCAESTVETGQTSSVPRSSSRTPGCGT